MSIQQIAQKYMKAASSELFKIHIEEETIKIIHPAYRFELTKEHTYPNEVVAYSVFFDSRFPAQNHNIDSVKIGFSYIVDYLNEAISITKHKGWAILHHKDVPPLHKVLIDMLETFKFHSVDKAALPYLTEYFKGPSFYSHILAFTLSEPLSIEINNSYKSIIAIENVLTVHPICVANVSIKRIFRHPIRFFYHGTTFNLYLNNARNQYRCVYLNSSSTHPFPLKEKDFEEILQNIELHFRLKNMIQPPMDYFSQFIETFIGPLSNGHLQREFEKSLSYFEDWVALETLFKKIIDNETELELVNSYTIKRSGPKTTITCKRLTHEGITLWFVSKNGNNFDIQTFVGDTKETQKKAIDVYNEFIDFELVKSGLFAKKFIYYHEES